MFPLEYTNCPQIKIISKNRNYSLVHSCKKCSYITKLLFFMKSHVRRHRSTARVPLFDCSRTPLEVFICVECTFKTFCTVTFANHIKDHSLSKQMTETNLQNKTKLSQDSTSFRFSRKFNTRNILQECSNKIADEPYLANHIEWFECDQCPSKFGRKNNLKHHVIAKHTPSKEIEWFQCDKCPYKAKLKSWLGRHMIQHAPEENIKWFHCDKCSSKFKQNDELKKHVLAKHTASEDIKWFQCDKCSYKAKLKPRLMEHIVRHVPEENIEWFECDKCSAKFKQKSYLKRHMNFKHTDFKDIQWFHCDKCLFKAKSKSSVNRHIKVNHKLEH